MHGGHYTAFVRVRSEVQLKDLKIASSSLHETGADQSKESCTTHGAVPEERTVPGEGAFVIPPSEENESESLSLAFSNGLENGSKVIGNAVTVPRSSSPLETKENKEGAAGASAASGRKKFGIDFDLSSTDGSWYHISDSHVRKSTESDVLRAEAYLLFYEKLPSIKTE